MFIYKNSVIPMQKRQTTPSTFATFVDEILCYTNKMLLCNYRTMYPKTIPFLTINKYKTLQQRDRADIDIWGKTPMSQIPESFTLRSQMGPSTNPNRHRKFRDSVSRLQYLRHCFDSFNSKCRRKSTIANADTRYPELVYPPNFPPPIFALQS